MNVPEGAEPTSQVAVEFSYSWPQNLKTLPGPLEKPWSLLAELFVSVFLPIAETFLAPSKKSWAACFSFVSLITFLPPVLRNGLRRTHQNVCEVGDLLAFELLVLVQDA